jgi:hypothetical protein
VHFPLAGPKGTKTSEYALGRGIRTRKRRADMGVRGASSGSVASVGTFRGRSSSRTDDRGRIRKPSRRATGRAESPGHAHAGSSILRASSASARQPSAELERATGPTNTNVVLDRLGMHFAETHASPFALGDFQNPSRRQVWDGRLLGEDTDPGTNADLGHPWTLG